MPRWFSLCFWLGLLPAFFHFAMITAQFDMTTTGSTGSHVVQSEPDPVVAAASGYGYERSVVYCRLPNVPGLTSFISSKKYGSKPHGYDYPIPRYSYPEATYDSGYYPEYKPKDCYGKLPGYQGDPAYECKQFELCQSDGRLDVFYCPENTKFNNYLSICDWPDKVDAYCNPLYVYQPEYPAYQEAPPKPQYEYPVSEPPSYSKATPRYYTPKYEAPRKEAYSPPPYSEYKDEPQYRAPEPAYRSVYKPDPLISYAAEAESPRLVGYDNVYLPIDSSPYVPNFAARKHSLY